MDATKPPLPQNYLKNLEKMRSDIATADFVIASGVDEEVDEHKVHRHVLNLHSEYFARLFNNGDYKVCSSEISQRRAYADVIPPRRIARTASSSWTTPRSPSSA